MYIPSDRIEVLEAERGADASNAAFTEEESCKYIKMQKTEEND